MIIRLAIDKSFPFSRLSFFHSRPPPMIDFSHPDDAVSLFHDMPSHPFAVTKLLRYFVKAKEYPTATNMIGKMRREGLPLNDYHMNVEIKCHCRMRRVELGFGVLGRFFKLGYAPNVYTHNTLLEGLFLVGNVSEAEKLFKKLLQGNIYDRDTTTIRTVMKGLRESKEFRRGGSLACMVRMVADALRLYEKLIRKGISPSASTYSSLIVGLLLFHWKIEAMDMLRDTASLGISLGRVTYDTLVNELGKNGWIKDAEEVLEIMMQLKVTPNITTYNALIDGYCSIGEIDKAREVLFDRLHHHAAAADIFTYDTLIDGYCKKGLVLEAWRLFEKIPSEILARGTTGIYVNMLVGLFSDGRCDDGMRLFEDMQNRQVPLNAWTCDMLLNALCDGQCADEALSLLNVMEAKGLVRANITTYNVVIDGLCRNKRIDLARNVFDNLLPSKGLQPNFWTRVSLVCGLCEQGMLIEAKDIIKEMEGGGCFETYNSLVKGYLQRNQLYEAIPLMAEMAEKGFKTSVGTKKMFLSQVKSEGDVALVMHNIKKNVLSR